MKTLEDMTIQELEAKLIEVRTRKMDCTRRRIEEKIKILLAAKKRSI